MEGMTRYGRKLGWLENDIYEVGKKGGPEVPAAGASPAAVDARALAEFEWGVGVRDSGWSAGDDSYSV